MTSVADLILGKELLWPFSMPPRIPDESRVAIAELGRGEDARRARLYRHGLALRYGKARQMINGVHANVSLGSSLLSLLSDESPLTSEELRSGRSSDGFFLRLARNLYADLPLFVLLFGASPVMGGGLESEPFAVSYRNSRFGYARDEFLPYLDLESLDAYLSGIRRGLRTVSMVFSRLGLVRDGRVIQLKPTVFQTDKEFYAPIRLRQTTMAGESALQALSARGVGYLEMRFLDVDPFSRIGIAEETLRLLHLFLLDGLTRPTAPRTNAILRQDIQTAADVALLKPDQLALNPFLCLAKRRLSDLEPWAKRIDAHTARDSYGQCLSRFLSRIAVPRTLPSAALARAFEKSGKDWTSFGVRTARGFRRLKQGAGHALEHARV